ncbi:zinc ribbon domain-containing protein [Methanobrevibacter sp. DSM 116169]|uniref:zinc ribbon domain-containing protein n=1 Tax=Methanobrevibacter sp. DSM 116169 TaxID=3242727 RepID=UPI0038FD342C
MVKICSRCGFKYKNSYNFCPNCGNESFIKDPDNIAIKNKHLIIGSYILTILFSWGGLLLNFILNFKNTSFFSFFGIFIPFYLIQSNNSLLKKHGYIQIVISLIGIILSILLIFR